MANLDLALRSWLELGGRLGTPATTTCLDGKESLGFSGLKPKPGNNFAKLPGIN